MIRTKLCLHTWKCPQCGPESRWTPRGLSSEGPRCWSICLLSQTHHKVSSSLSAACCWRSRWKASCLRSCPPVSRFLLWVRAAAVRSRKVEREPHSLTFGDFNAKSLGISDRFLFLCVVTNEGVRTSHLKYQCHSKYFRLSYMSQQYSPCNNIILLLISPCEENAPCRWRQSCRCSWQSRCFPLLLRSIQRYGCLQTGLGTQPKCQTVSRSQWPVALYGLGLCHSTRSKEEMEQKHCSLSRTEGGQNYSFSGIKFYKRSEP